MYANKIWSGRDIVFRLFQAHHRRGDTSEPGSCFVVAAASGRGVVRRVWRHSLGWVAGECYFVGQLDSRRSVHFWNEKRSQENTTGFRGWSWRKKSVRSFSITRVRFAKTHLIIIISFRTTRVRPMNWE